MQADLGGAFYEMAIRDHVRLDVLTRKAAELQRVDAELLAVERQLELERTDAAGHCPTCNAPFGHGGRFCPQCGSSLVAVAAAEARRGRIPAEADRRRGALTGKKFGLLVASSLIATTGIVSAALHSSKRRRPAGGRGGGSPDGTAADGGDRLGPGCRRPQKRPPPPLPNRRRARKPRPPEPLPESAPSAAPESVAQQRAGNAGSAAAPERTRTARSGPDQARLPDLAGEPRLRRRLQHHRLADALPLRDAAPAGRAAHQLLAAGRRRAAERRSRRSAARRPPPTPRPTAPTTKSASSRWKP